MEFERKSAEKGIYAVFGRPTNEDLKAIQAARAVFPYVDVAIQSVPNQDEDDALDRAKDYLTIISQIKNSGSDSVGLSINFFEEGKLEEFLNQSNALSWIVPRGISAEFVARTNFPKYFIDSRHY
jgi:hypothetical protein